MKIVSAIKGEMAGTQSKKYQEKTLLRHIKTHSEIQNKGEKPFQCNYCHKAFFNKKCSFET